MAASQNWTAIVILLGSFLLIRPIMGVFRKNKFDVHGSTVLLTGASEGMGKSVANRLAQKGANIIIVSRNVQKLEAALAEIKASAANASSQRFHFISADVSEQHEAARVVAEAIAWNNGQSPDIVWCIAGSAFPHLFLDVQPAKMRQQMDINYWSCVDMAHATLSEWLSPHSVGKGKQRHLIFTSSVVAFYNLAGYSPYAPAKAAIKSFSDTLAQELLLYGDDVKIHTVFPGSISSPGLEQENKSKPEITHMLEEADPVQSPDEVAAGAIAGLENGEYLITVGWLGALMRGTAWGGSPRNNWLVDTATMWVASVVALFVGKDLDGKVRAYGKKKGHPSTYAREV